MMNIVANFFVVVVTEAEGVCRCQEDVFGEKVYMFATKVIPAQEREIGLKKKKEWRPEAMT
jgi:hypothetical protein